MQNQHYPRSTPKPGHGCACACLALLGSMSTTKGTNGTPQGSSSSPRFGCRLDPTCSPWVGRARPCQRTSPIPQHSPCPEGRHPASPVQPDGAEPGAAASRGLPRSLCPRSDTGSRRPSTGYFARGIKLSFCAVLFPPGHWQVSLGSRDGRAEPGECPHCTACHGGTTRTLPPWSVLPGTPNIPSDPRPADKRSSPSCFGLVAQQLVPVFRAHPVSPTVPGLPTRPAAGGALATGETSRPDPGHRGSGGEAPGHPGRRGGPSPAPARQ